MPSLRSLMDRSRRWPPDHGHHHHHHHHPRRISWIVEEESSYAGNSELDHHRIKTMRDQNGAGDDADAASTVVNGGGDDDDDDDDDDAEAPLEEMTSSESSSSSSKSKHEIVGEEALIALLRNAWSPCCGSSCSNYIISNSSNSTRSSSRSTTSSLSEGADDGGSRTSRASAVDDEKLEWLRSQVVGIDDCTRDDDDGDDDDDDDDEADYQLAMAARADASDSWSCRPWRRKPKKKKMKKIVYVDHTASGKPLRFIEEFMLHNVLPFYGNTHTEDSYVGRVTGRMVRESEEYVKRKMGGQAHEHALLFCGSGTTGAIKRLQEVMGIAISPLLRPLVLRMLARHQMSNGLNLINGSDRIESLVRRRSSSVVPRWVVFTGPYEHHSNLLSWRQSLAEVVEIPSDGGAEGCIDMQKLEDALRAYSRLRPARKLLGSFSACSNVTGLLTDTRAIARLLHRYGAFACFDFAAAAPHEDIDMKSANGADGDYYDAVVMSPHKLMGGPGTPGILLLRRSLYGLVQTAPSTAGGGTVSFVSGFDEQETLYHSEIEVREDAGTPAILGKIRCALAFWVRDFIGLEVIRGIEAAYLNKATLRLSEHPNIEILGQTKPPSLQIRAPILSFVILCSGEHWGRLHGGFVARLLDDAFGIQSRGGCACAGPYGHFLLGIDRAASSAIRDQIKQGYEGHKPSFTRVSFSYNMLEEEVEYVISSIEWIASHGHRLLALYDFDWRTGSWTSRNPAQNLDLLSVTNRRQLTPPVPRTNFSELSFCHCKS